MGEAQRGDTTTGEVPNETMCNGESMKRENSPFAAAFWSKAAFVLLLLHATAAAATATTAVTATAAAAAFSSFVCWLSSVYQFM